VTGEVAQRDSRPAGQAADPGNGPIVVLSYLHSGAEAVQEALAAGTDLACTQATGIVPLAAAAVETWQRLEDRPGRPVSALAAASVRELITTQLITVLSAGRGSRWCELAVTSPDLAARFAQVVPATRFVCVHRASAAVIQAGVEAGRWGLGGQVPPSYIMSYSGNSVAALAAYWAESTQALLTFEAAHPRVSHRIRYEDIVTGPGQALDTVQAALSLRPRVRTGLLEPVDPDAQAAEQAGAADPAGLPVDKIPRPLRETIARLHTELGYPHLPGPGPA
jgi:hypothetical protein